ncbi:hypothetical protein M422DRAFT_242579 [Sphaerobolus stellatus SS14]|nr:hypothetical protein M422DRAFT_242579 [Sphaerobolus stellatus SS14]
MFCLDEYTRSLSGLPRNLVTRHDDLDWMTDDIQSFNSNPSGVPQNLQLEGLHVNVDADDVWANKIASLKGGAMNHFRVHDDLLPLVQGSPFYFPPTVGEPMDQDEPEPEPILIQRIGSSSLADRLDYGEGGSFSQPPANAHELRARISYFDSLVPQGTVRASTAELSEELTHELYADNLE